MMFLVIEEREGQTGFVGPFETREVARAWAATRAEAVAGDRRHLINASPDGDVVMLGRDHPDDDVEAEWLVEPMTDPGSV